MSIFKDTFKDYVKDQITTRQDLLSKEGERPIEFQKYVSAKSPWARMVSFVDYEKKIDLAKNYVLYGGTLYQVPNTSGPGGTNNPNLTRLRYGISSEGSAYGSELGTREYGIRPMPGIESISVRTISAYGSLRETTIKYYAWDLKQLQDLNILYMKPGYPVLVEWGWSLYLNNRKNNTDLFQINNNFVNIDAFEKGISQQKVYDLIKQYTEKHYGNYDASLGFIKNYSYTLLRNGGFECTTTLISMGDVINSLKINGGISEESSDDAETTASEVNDEFCSLLTQISNGVVTTYPNYTKVRQSYPLKIASEQYTNTSYSDITKVLILRNPGDVKELPGGDSRYTKFIAFGYFIHVLNNYASLFSSKNGTSYEENFVSIEIPDPNIKTNIGSGYCVSSTNAMSINNDVCFIFNDSNVLIKDKNNKSIGFKPDVGSIETRNTNSALVFYKPDPINLGVIGNIYVNIGFLISTYKSIPKDSKGTISLSVYLKKILKEIEFTLGSINDFDIISIDNRGIIVDKHYVEPLNNTNKNEKFELNIMGLNNTVREHQVVSKIFEEQSTMIAIAAQDRENIAAIQTSTNVELNKNIYNRLYRNISNRKSNNTDVDTTNTNIIYKNTQTLLSFVTNFIITGKRPIYTDTSLSALNSYLNHFITVKDGGTNYKGIIPISLNIKLDGISGITIGEIFRINADVLPSEYKDKSVGFIVTGIDHVIDRHDWVTNLKTQFCLLDQKEKYVLSKIKSDDFAKKFGEYAKEQIVKTKIQVHYYNILISILHDFYNNYFNFLNKIVNKEDGTYYYIPYVEYNDYDDAGSVKAPSNMRIAQNYIASYNIDNSDTTIFKTELGVLTSRTPVTLNKGGNVSLLNYNPLSYYITSGQFYNNYFPNSENTLINKEAVVYYLNYVIKNNKYYIGLENTTLKSTFDEVFNYIITRYVDSNTAIDKTWASIKLLFDISIGDGEGIAQNLISITDLNIVKVSYINPESVDPYGNLQKVNIILSKDIFIKLNEF